MNSDVFVWDIIKRGEQQGVPSWICKLQQNEIDALVEKQRCSVHTNVVDESYITFLEQQISLGARGPQWSGILKKRIDELKRFIGKNVSTVMFACDEVTVTIRIDPEMETILFVEVV